MEDICLRCEHKWFRRSHEPPRTCPKCRSLSWNKKPEARICACGKVIEKVALKCNMCRLLENLKKADKPARAHYDIHDIEIGQTRQFPFTDDTAKNLSMCSAITQAARRAGKEFMLFPEVGYLTIKRIR